MNKEIHSTSTTRRTLLRGLAGLPLIGGSLAIVGAPSAPVSLVQAATLSGIDDPRERAQFAWKAFTSAMDDLTADASGWKILGASSVRPCGPVQGYEFARFAEVRVGPEYDPLDRGLIVEVSREIALDPLDEAVLRAREAVRKHHHTSFAGRA